MAVALPCPLLSLLLVGVVTSGGKEAVPSCQTSWRRLLLEGVRLVSPLPLNSTNLLCFVFSRSGSKAGVVKDGTGGAEEEEDGHRDTSNFSTSSLTRFLLSVTLFIIFSACVCVLLLTSLSIAPLRDSRGSPTSPGAATPIVHTFAGGGSTVRLDGGAAHGLCVQGHGVGDDDLPLYHGFPTPSLSVLSRNPAFMPPSCSMSSWPSLSTCPPCNSSPSLGLPCSLL